MMWNFFDLYDRTGRLFLRVDGGVGAERGDECGQNRNHDVHDALDGVLLCFVHVVQEFKGSRVQGFKSLRVQDFKITDFTD